MLRLRGASAISNSLCNRHRNNDHCLATGQVAARCRKGTRVMRAAPARLPRRTAHARAGGGAGRGLGRGRRRERGGGGGGERGGAAGSGSCCQPVQVARPAPPGHRCGQITPGLGAREGATPRGALFVPLPSAGPLKEQSCPRASKNSFFSVCLVGFFPPLPAPPPQLRPHQDH